MADPAQEPESPAAGPSQPNPSQIMQLATGYWASATLLAANDLGVFAALGDGGRSVEEVAARSGTASRSMKMLLDACCGLGLLVKQAGIYSLADASAAFLVPGR